MTRQLVQGTEVMIYATPHAHFVRILGHSSFAALTSECLQLPCGSCVQEGFLIAPKRSPKGLQGELG